MKEYCGIFRRRSIRKRRTCCSPEQSKLHYVVSNATHRSDPAKSSSPVQPFGMSHAKDNTVEDWPSIVNGMSHRASLKPAECDTIVAYILAVRSAAQYWSNPRQANVATQYS